MGLPQWLSGCNIFDLWISFLKVKAKFINTKLFTFICFVTHSTSFIYLFMKFIFISSTPIIQFFLKSLIFVSISVFIITDAKIYKKKIIFVFVNRKVINIYKIPFKITILFSQKMIILRNKARMERKLLATYLMISSCQDWFSG